MTPSFTVDIALSVPPERFGRGRAEARVDAGPEGFDAASLGAQLARMLDARAVRADALVFEDVGVLASMPWEAVAVVDFAGALVPLLGGAPRGPLHARVNVRLPLPEGWAAPSCLPDSRKGKVGPAGWSARWRRAAGALTGTFALAVSTPPSEAEWATLAEALAAMAPETVKVGPACLGAMASLDLARAARSAARDPRARPAWLAQHGFLDAALAEVAADDHLARAWLLRHDPLGRPFHPGHDREGALAEARAAVAAGAHGADRLLVETLRDGRGAARDFPTEDAGELLEAIGRLHSSVARAHAGDAVMCLLALGRADEARALLPTAGHTPAGVAAVAMLDGVKTARAHLKAASVAGERAEVQREAANHLFALRRYREAVEVAPSWAAPGGCDKDWLFGCRRAQDVPVEPGSPVAALRAAARVDGTGGAESLRSVAPYTRRRYGDVAVADLLVSSAEVIAADRAVGAFVQSTIRMNGFTVRVPSWYVPDGDGWRLVTAGVDGYGRLGEEALRRLPGDPAAARALLGWAVEGAAGDDTLGIAWTALRDLPHGPERFAGALALHADPGRPVPPTADLPPDAAGPLIEIVVRALVSAERWVDALPLAEDAVARTAPRAAAQPGLAAAALSRAAYLRAVTGDFAGARTASDEAVALLPDDPVTLARHAQVLARIGAPPEEVLATARAASGQIAPVSVVPFHNVVWYLLFGTEADRAVASRLASSAHGQGLEAALPAWASTAAAAHLDSPGLARISLRQAYTGPVPATPAVLYLRGCFADAIGEVAIARACLGAVPRSSGPDAAFTVGALADARLALLEARAAPETKRGRAEGGDIAFRARYARFLDDLDAIASEHDELTDTDVRERLHAVLSWYFVHDRPLEGLPKKYAMFSARGDARVARAVRAFLKDARSLAPPDPALRHAALHDRTIETTGGYTFDVFLGWTDAPLPAEPPAPDEHYGDYGDA
ncbi:MAG: hypothetical protein ACOZNI_06780 [Myxococcota bacterium]